MEAQNVMRGKTIFILVCMYYVYINMSERPETTSFLRIRWLDSFRPKRSLRSIVNFIERQQNIYIYTDADTMLMSRKKMTLGRRGKGSCPARDDVLKNFRSLLVRTYHGLCAQWSYRVPIFLRPMHTSTYTHAHARTFVYVRNIKYMIFIILHKIHNFVETNFSTQFFVVLPWVDNLTLCSNRASFWYFKNVSSLELGTFSLLALLKFT